jgi:hypothetical protein
MKKGKIKVATLMAVASWTMSPAYGAELDQNDEALRIFSGKQAEKIERQIAKDNTMYRAALHVAAKASVGSITLAPGVGAEMSALCAGPLHRLARNGPTQNAILYVYLILLERCNDPDIYPRAAARLVELTLPDGIVPIAQRLFVLIFPANPWPQTTIEAVALADERGVPVDSRMRIRPDFAGMRILVVVANRRGILWTPEQRWGFSRIVNALEQVDRLSAAMIDSHYRLMAHYSGMYSRFLADPTPYASEEDMLRLFDHVREMTLTGAQVEYDESERQ